MMCTVAACTNLPQQVATLCTHSYLFLFRPLLSSPRSRSQLPWLLTTSILLLSSSNFLPFLLELDCPRPRIPESFPRLLA